MLHKRVPNEKRYGADGSIFAKHQILTVSHRKSLFVAPLDDRLHCCPESNFSIINQLNHRQ
ncbi:Uncharacterised protein [Serratia liquefaciens]|nr:Uncharacterised protein [Serratia liquefaciens]